MYSENDILYLVITLYICDNCASAFPFYAFNDEEFLVFLVLSLNIGLQSMVVQFVCKY